MLCSKLDWFEVLKWKLESIGKKPRHGSDLFVRHFEGVDGKKDYILWLGHASFYIRIKGKGILLDPVFGDIPFHRRLIPMPCDTGALDVDLILISHGHFDHLDTASLKLFDAPVIAPKGLGRYIKNKDVTELEWEEEHSFEDIKITSLWAKHWHQRGLFDKNRALWCSFLIEDIFFAGDSAYSTHFKRIGAGYDVKTALLPIGAYEPRKIMRENHLNPDEAYRAFLDLEASMFIPYHYGTFILSDEPVEEPLMRIEEIARRDGRIRILSPGSALIFQDSAVGRVGDESFH